MIALNASIQAAELNEQGHGFIAVSEEVERLSKRANETNKSISSLNKYIQAEINQVENSLEQSVSEAANLSKFALESSNSISELERYIRQFLNMQQKIASYTNENTDETEKAYQVFISSVSQTEKNILVLKEANDNLRVINTSNNSLQDSIEEFDIQTHSQPVPEQISPVLPQLGDSFEDTPAA
jgi:methyl-accepting chemotaxis protein